MRKWQKGLGTWAVVSLRVRKRTGRGSGGSSVLPEELGSTIHSPQLKLVLTSHLSTSDKEIIEAKGNKGKGGE